MGVHDFEATGQPLDGLRLDLGLTIESLGTAILGKSDGGGGAGERTVYCPYTPPMWN